MAADCDQCEFVAKSNAGLSAHVRAKHPSGPEGSVFEATQKAVSSASHLDDRDAGTVEVLLGLAKRIDGLPEGSRDNVTVPTYLKFASELGLTPVSRDRLDLKEAPGGSKLAELRAIRGGKAS